MGIGSNWGKASNMLHFSSNLEHLETLAPGNKGKQTSVPLEEVMLLDTPHATL